MSKLFPISNPKSAVPRLYEFLVKEKLPKDQVHWHDEWPSRGSTFFVRYAIDYFAKAYQTDDEEVKSLLRGYVRSGWPMFWMWTQFFVRRILSEDFLIQTSADLAALTFCRISLVDFLVAYHDVSTPNGDGWVLSRSSRNEKVIALLFNSAILSSDTAIVSRACRLMFLLSFEPGRDTENATLLITELSFLPNSEQIAFECLSLVHRRGVALDVCHTLIQVFCGISAASEEPVPAFNRHKPVQQLAKALGRVSRRFPFPIHPWDPDTVGLDETIVSCISHGLLYLMYVLSHDQAHMSQYALQLVNGNILPVLLKGLVLFDGFQSLAQVCNDMIVCITRCVNLGSSRLIRSVARAVTACGDDWCQSPSVELKRDGAWAMLSVISRATKDNWNKFLQLQLAMCQGPKVRMVCFGCFCNRHIDPFLVSAYLHGV